MQNITLAFLIGLAAGFTLSIITAHIVIDKIMQSLKLIEIEMDKDEF